MAKPKPDSGDKIFRVLPRQVDQTIAAALRQWLPGKSWSEVRRLLKSRQVMVNGNLCADAGYRLRLVDVVKLLPHSAGAAGARRGRPHPVSRQAHCRGREAGRHDLDAACRRARNCRRASGSFSRRWMNCCRG